MASLRSLQTARGVKREPAPGEFQLGARSLDAAFSQKPSETGLSAVPVTNKREAVWRRLGELAGTMRKQGVGELKILDLLTYHTPGQIELAFSKHPTIHPDAVADLILRGRYGYRAGIKQNKKPPDTRPAAQLLTETRKKEAQCPAVSQVRLQGLLTDFLEGLTQ